MGHCLPKFTNCRYTCWASSLVVYVKARDFCHVQPRIKIAILFLLSKKNYFQSKNSTVWLDQLKCLGTTQLWACRRNFSWIIGKVTNKSKTMRRKLLRQLGPSRVVLYWVTHFWIEKLISHVRLSLEQVKRVKNRCDWQHLHLWYWKWLLFKASSQHVNKLRLQLLVNGRKNIQDSAKDAHNQSINHTGNDLFFAGQCSEKTNVVVRNYSLNGRRIHNLSGLDHWT